MSLGTTARTSFLALDADTGTLMGWSLLTQTRLGRRTACGSHYHLEGAGMMPRPRPACSELEDALDRANTDLAGLGEHREDRAHRVLRHAEAPAELRRAHLTRSLGQAAEDVAVELAPEIHCGWTIRHEGPSVTMPRERHNHRGLDASRVSHEGLGGGVVTVARYDLTFAALVPVEIAWRRESAAVHERLTIDVGQNFFRRSDPPVLQLHPGHPALTPKLRQAHHLSHVFSLAAARPSHRPSRPPPARLQRRS